MATEKEQPILRYLRMKSVNEGLASVKVASSLAMERGLCLGLSDGELLLVSSQGSISRRWRGTIEANPVRAIAASGNFITSCSDDGWIVVHDTTQTTDELPEAQESYRVGQPLSCVQLDPNHGNIKEKRFVVGGPNGQLVMSRRGWRGQQDRVLHEGEGNISAITWLRGTTLLAWGNEKGVKVLDLETGEKITFVERPNFSGPECHLICWDQRTLLVGWSSCVQTLEFVSHPANEPARAGTRSAEIVRVLEGF